MGKKNTKKIIIGVVAIIVLFFAYSVFVKDDTEKDLLITQTVSGIEDSPAIQELFLILNQLSQLKINTSIFQSAAYKSLEDYTVTVSPQPKGRENPFGQFEQ